MGSEDLSKKMSFSIDVGEGKKLRLIDMAKEDDYLIASPLYHSLEDLRLSVTLGSNHADENYKCKGIVPCAERLQQNEPNLLLFSDSFMETGRPSYMRKSLAWDTAFFTNDGVLDPDELFLMNKGLKTRSLPSIQEDVLLRRSEPEPTAFKKNIDAHSQMKSSKHVSKVKSVRTLLQASEKSRNQISRSVEYQRMSLKPSKTTGLLSSIPTGRGQRPLMEKKKDIAKQDKSVQTRAVSSFAGRNLTPSNSQPRRMTVTSPDIWKNYLKRKTESTRSKLSASVSIITPSRYPEKSKRQATDLRHSTQSLPAISNYSSGDSTSDFVVDRSVIGKSKELPEPNPHSQFYSLLEREISSPLPFSTASPFGNSPAPTRSGLRMPSPTIGYFDEEKPVARTAIGGLQFQLQMHNKSPSKSAARCRKTPAKIANSALAADMHNRKHRLVDKQGLHSNRKLMTGSDVRHTASNIWSISISAMKEENLSRSRNLCAGKYSREKIDQGTTLKGGEKRIKELSHSMMVRENKRYKTKEKFNGAKVTYHPKNGNEPKENKNATPKLGGEVNELSKLLEVIDLNEAKVIEQKQRRSQYSTTRAKENVPQMFSDASPLLSAEPVLITRSPLGNKNICLL